MVSSNPHTHLFPRTLFVGLLLSLVSSRVGSGSFYFFKKNVLLSPHMNFLGDSSRAFRQRALERLES